MFLFGFVFYRGGKGWGQEWMGGVALRSTAGRFNRAVNHVLYGRQVPVADQGVPEDRKRVARFLRCCW